MIQMLEHVVASKIFSLIHTLQGSILTLVYPWYNNMKQNRKKDKINSIIRTRTFNIYNIHTSGIKRMNTPTFLNN